MEYSIRKKDLERVCESTVTDRAFEEVINVADDKVRITNKWFSNPERLPCPQRAIYDTLVRAGLINVAGARGICLFLTKNNPALKRLVGGKNVLQCFLLEPCLFSVLFREETIATIEELRREVEERVREQDDEVVSNYVARGMELACNKSLLTLNVLISSYIKTYGDGTISEQGGGTEPGLQIELSYNFDNCSSVTEDVKKQMRFCTVRFDFNRFLSYLQRYNGVFLEQVAEKHSQLQLRRQSLGEGKVPVQGVGAKDHAEREVVSPSAELENRGVEGDESVHVNPPAKKPKVEE